MLARLSDVDLFYQDIGAGLPLLVHHGGPGFDHSSICPFLEDMAGCLRLVCFDHRGTGRSSRPRGDEYDISAFARDIEGLRRFLGVPQISLLGHSFGGMVALQYALEYPEVLSRLVLVSTAASHGYLKEGADNLRKVVDRAEWEQLELIAAGPPSAQNMRRAFELQIPIFFRLSEDARALDLDNVRLGPGSQAAWGRLSGLDLRHRLGQVQASTLVVAGRHDLAIPLRYSEEVARLIPGAQLEISERSAHFPYIEDRQWFLEVVLRFLGLAGERAK